MARKIPASLTKAYNRAIKRQGGASERAVKSALTEYIAENPEATVEELREYAIELLKSASELYGNACSQAAFDLQDEIAREFGAKPPNMGGWYYEPDAESIEKTVHYHAGKLVDGDVAGFVREMGSAARFYAERGANATMVETAKKQDRENRRSKRTGARTHGVTFARVPQGATTCGFCFMLASRGFVYLTEESAGEFDKFHKNCDCRIMPGYPGMELEGYDWAGMYSRWKQCEDTIGVEDGWSYLRREETIKEAERRDRPWLLGKRDACNGIKNVCPQTIERGADPDDKERALAFVLRQKGFVVDFRKPIDKNRKRTADALFNGERWEMKNPDGSSDKAVKNQLKSAVGTHGKEQQCDRVVISNVSETTTLTFEQMCAQAQELWDAGRFVEIKELLIVDKDGRMKRFMERK